MFPERKTRPEFRVTEEGECDVLVDLSGLGWGELVEQGRARPYWPSAKELAISIPVHKHGQSVLDGASKQARQQSLFTSPRR